MLVALLLLALWFAYGPGLTGPAPPPPPTSASSSVPSPTDVQDCRQWVRTPSAVREPIAMGILLELREQSGVMIRPDADLVSSYDQAVFEACQREPGRTVSDRAFVVWSDDPAYWSQ